MIAFLSLATVVMSPPRFWPLPQKRAVGKAFGTITSTSFEFASDQPAAPILTQAFARYTQLCIRGRLGGHKLPGNTTVLEALDVRIFSSDEYLGLETVWNYVFVCPKQG